MASLYAKTAGFKIEDIAYIDKRNIYYDKPLFL